MNTIETLFVPYELAVKLKQLGFDEPCFGYWNIDPYLPNPTFNLVKPFDHEWCIPAPLYQQAFRWFREKYNLKSWIEEYTKNKYIYEIRPHRITDYKEGEIYVYAAYEEAEVACLNKLIEIVKTKSE